jgi:hypothetical protein
VAGSRLVDQELVVHVFAPVEGPHTARAYQQIREIWDRCHHRLGMTAPIPSTGLPTGLPPDPLRMPPDQALAAQEDRAADYQAIVRREHDVVNLSMVFAAPADTQSRRLRIGSASPPGWIEFHRWWEELAAGGTDALLGVVLVCQAKFTGQVASPTDALAQQVRAVLPATGHEEPYWWQRGHVSPDGFAVWETSPDGDRLERQLVVIAPEGRDPQLSAWTWSRGDVAMPPLARYLLHAAKLRYQARVRGDGQQIAQLRERVNDRVAQLARMLNAPSDHAAELAERRRLRADEAELRLTATDVRNMRHTVRIAVDNMARSLAEPLGADRRLADWFPRQLEADAEYLDTALQSAQHIGRLVGDRMGENTVPPSEPTDPQPVGKPVPPSHDATRSAPGPGRTLVRMGFAVDVVGYSTRSAPQKEDAQYRLRTLVHDVLGHLDLRIEETDHQGTGDGMNVFLPVTVELHRALPRLIRAWEERLAFDNQRFRDRLRLRMATVVGPVGLAALGFSGYTVVEVNRLLDSQVLRQALRDHPDADLAVLVSDQLYQYVIGEGYPGLDASRFERHLIEVNEYRKHAWLWIQK